MSWIILFFAGLFEVGWAVGLKYTDGFTRPLPTVLTVAAMAISLGLLGLAMKELPLGTAYAIWTGVGAVGTVIAGIILFGESMALVRLASVALIISGLVGLKVSAEATTAFASKPAPTGFVYSHTYRAHHQSLWERACSRRGPNCHRLSDCPAQIPHQRL